MSLAGAEVIALAERIRAHRTGISVAKRGNPLHFGATLASATPL